MPYKRFESELTVRPDDIDMNNHVHMSRYLDYYLSARYYQMDHFYGFAMDEFIKNGWSWVVKSASLEFKRPLFLSDTALVRTWIEEFGKSDVRVGFQIYRRNGMKLCAEGSVVNTMVNVKTGRAEIIPSWVIERYTQFTE
jgi:YbgC/YbaW family acyl-CoA thioester hydrolase